MLELTNKSEGKIFNDYLKNTGYSSLEQYKQDAGKDNSLLQGLLFIIGAILLVEIISKLFDSKK
jgi:hypothetical protein